MNLLLDVQRVRCFMMHLKQQCKRIDFKRVITVLINY
jgi:hypothetical protein